MWISRIHLGYYWARSGKMTKVQCGVRLRHCRDRCPGFIILGAPIARPKEYTELSAKRLRSSIGARGRHARLRSPAEACAHSTILTFQVGEIEWTRSDQSLGRTRDPHDWTHMLPSHAADGVLLLLLRTRPKICMVILILACADCAECRPFSCRPVFSIPVG